MGCCGPPCAAQASEGDEAIAALAATGQIRDVQAQHLPAGRGETPSSTPNPSALCGIIPPPCVFCPAGASTPSFPTSPPYDAVLLDIVFRYTDGMATCATLRTAYGCVGLPIIATTGNVVGADRLRSAGFNALVEKPFGEAAIDAALAECAAAVGAPGTPTIAIKAPAGHGDSAV
jgi:CheY-like chemotaxis protein